MLIEFSLLLQLLMPAVTFSPQHAPVTLVPATNMETPPAKLLYTQPELDKGVLLVAGRNLKDPNFEKSVVLITAYDENGTAGIIVNRQTDIPVPVTIPGISKLLSLLGFFYIGGPVSINGVSLLMRSDIPVQGVNEITDNIYHINSMTQLQNLDVNSIDTRYARLYAGISGWAPGQLESELLRGDWHIWHASADTVFSSEPGKLWFELISVVSARWVYLRMNYSQRGHRANYGSE